MDRAAAVLAEDGVLEDGRPASVARSQAQPVDVAVTAAAGALDQLQGLDLDALDGDRVRQLLEQGEVLARRLAAVQTAVVDTIDRRSLHHADGHFSARVMVRHVGRLHGGRASARIKAARALRDLPELAAAFAAGRIGVDQVELLGKVHANPRVRDAMPGREATFIEWAQRRSYRAFEASVRSWERRVDEDGPEPRNERTHRTRDVRMVQDHFSQAWHLKAVYAALQGAAMREILDHYIEAEYLADWEKARAELGDQATAEHLPRTDAQRRADALWQIFQDAAGSPHGAVRPGYTHNVVWSAEAFEEMLRRLSGERPRPFDDDTYRCETIDGVQLDPTEAIANALVSSVRRVVVDAAGVVLDMGHKRRFTGALRDAVNLHSDHCVWPGCEVPATRCEADHLHDHAKHGRTCPGNGAPLCGGHNRWKQKGFTVWRDPAGEWHTLRPDGSEIS